MAISENSVIGREELLKALAVAAPLSHAAWYEMHCVKYPAPNRFEPLLVIRDESAPPVQADMIALQYYWNLDPCPIYVDILGTN